MSEVVVAIRPRALGDVVLATAAFASLAAGHRDAELHVVTEPRFAPLVEGLPGIVRVWPLERSALGSLRVLAGLRRRRIRSAVDFFGNPRTALLARASGAREVWGYDLRGRRRAYHRTVPREQGAEPGRREHALAVHLRLARAAGGADVEPRPRVHVGAAARAEADRLLAAARVREPGRAIGLLAAGSWRTKAWPISHSAVLARALLAGGREVLAIAGPGEERVIARLAALAPGVAVLPPCATDVLAAAIARLGGLAGTDSGPRHLAWALGTPSFGWFGPTHPDTWNPPDPAHGHWRSPLPCAGCDRTTCPHWCCLPGLAPGEGVRLVLAHFERHGRTTSDLGPAARA